MENLVDTPTKPRQSTELMARKRSPDATLRAFFWILAVVFGSLQAWSSRFTMVNDTISYLDMGDYIFHGHWLMAINGIWNPLYAGLLGLTLGLVRPSLTWQYPVVHLLLFFIFLFAFWCFEFFVQGLISFRYDNETRYELHVPARVWLTIAYVLFLWSSLALIGVSETNPDMLVAAVFYLACGLLIRIHRGQERVPTYLALGLVLGFGYLTKSVMFPISLVCLATAWLVGRGRRRHALTFAAAMVGFVVVAGPFIAGISHAKHKLSFGESGGYNYAVHVNKVDPHYWTGENPGNGTPVHPVHKIFETPATYEFGSAPGTYPMWYDPTYWYEGVKWHFDGHEQWASFHANLRSEILVIFYLSGSIICGLFVLFYVSPWKSKIVKNFLALWFLWLPAAAALGSYSLVWFEPRYVAPFVVVATLCFFFSIHHPKTNESRKLFSGVAILLFIMFVSPIGLGTVPKNFSTIFRFRHSLTPPPDSYPVVASQMLQMGLHPGDHISSLEFSNLGVAMWARLAGLKIVSEVYYWPGRDQASSDYDFWDADPSTKDKILQALAATGTRAVVSHEMPRGADNANWLKVGETGYYLHWFPTPPGLSRTKSDRERGRSRNSESIH